MVATGKKGYTGYLSNGSYALNGAVVSTPSAGSSSSGASASTGSVAQGVNSYTQNSLASAIAGIAGTDASDYGDYIRQALDYAESNTATSQAFAREQMEYQTQSNEKAMAWSAQEAQKNRDWQERLSNTAHQREVEDLVSAGLNPILSANGGAYTGSGATGQSFSSSGAQGTVDTSASSVLASLINNTITSANNLKIAQLYTDAERYNTDANLQMANLSADVNILNNERTTAATRAAASMNAGAIINSAQKSYDASVYGANMNALNTRYTSDNSLTGTKYSADTSASNTKYSSDKSYESTKYNSDSNLWNNPLNYGEKIGNYIIDYAKKIGSALTGSNSSSRGSSYGRSF